MNFQALRANYFLEAKAVIISRKKEVTQEQVSTCPVGTWLDSFPVCVSEKKMPKVAPRLVTDHPFLLYFG